MRNLVFILGLLFLVGCATSKTVRKGSSLESTHWVLSTYGGKAYSPMADAKSVALTFQPEGNRIVGFGGCNSFSGSYALEGNTIQFTVISTKMYCNDTMQVEDYLFKTLTKVAYSIEGDSLTLKNENGNSVTFRKS